jgi:hypothetical protein
MFIIRDKEVSICVKCVCFGVVGGLVCVFCSDFVAEYDSGVGKV